MGALPAAAETIVAIATPPGRGGIGVVRLSGPAVEPIARSLVGRLPAPRSAQLATWRADDGEPIDRGITLFFPAPGSYTGESVLELQGHGGPVVMERLVARCVELGARPARPGEFTERAYLNGKLDLAQAEAVADLIDSGTEQAARSALRSLEGAFSDRVHDLVSRVTALRIHVEAAIDFADEAIDPQGEAWVANELDVITGKLAELLAGARVGRILRDGLSVVIAGPPNAGKSSLLNCFAGHDAAIVTDTPGTTRDLLREYVSLDGLPLHLVDTAGLREGGDAVEREGMRRARAQVEHAERVLLVVDDAATDDADVADLVAGCGAPGRVTLVRNKIDLSGREPGHMVAAGLQQISLSLRTGEGVDVLREHLKYVSGYFVQDEGIYSARRRHVVALGVAGEALSRGCEMARSGTAPELVAEDLRLVQKALGELTGEVSSDTLLGEIFAAFCIGK